MNTLIKLLAVLGIVTAITLGFVQKGNASVGVSAAAYMRHFVWRGGYGYYEVIQGSGTGGGFVNSGRSPMSDGTGVVGYTDRATRGESMRSDYGGSGFATKVGFGWLGVDRNWQSNVWLPYIINRTVPTDPSRDYCYSFAVVDGVRTVLPLPIGTR